MAIIFIKNTVGTKETASVGMEATSMLCLENINDSLCLNVLNLSSFSNYMFKIYIKIS